tara:strand:+ start:702 stop:1112 length:411 start_codon:yes stop_codon:yes gene_type:complete
MAMQGDIAAGHMHFCNYCKGILATDHWLSTHMKQPILRNVRTGVFDGGPAGYKCPTCGGEMVKGPVQTSQGSMIEIDGCLRCGSLWFDNREIEPFYPEIKDILPDQESSTSKLGNAIVRKLTSLFERTGDETDQEE